MLYNNLFSFFLSNIFQIFLRLASFHIRVFIYFMNFTLINSTTTETSKCTTKECPVFLSNEDNLYTHWPEWPSETNNIIISNEKQCSDHSHISSIQQQNELSKKQPIGIEINSNWIPSENKQHQFLLQQGFKR
jgi:hypothetical protein